MNAGSMVAGGWQLPDEAMDDQDKHGAHVDAQVPRWKIQMVPLPYLSGTTSWWHSMKTDFSSIRASDRNLKVNSS